MREKTEKVKEKIMKKVLDLVGRHGVKALSARKLADALNMTQANLYHHFKNMDEIISETIMYHLASYRKDIFYEEHDDVYEFLVATEYGILKYIESNIVQVKGYLTLCVSYTHKKELKERMNDLVLSRRKTSAEKIHGMIGDKVDKERIDRFMMGVSLLMEGSHQYGVAAGFNKEYFEGFKCALKAMVDDLLKHT